MIRRLWLGACALGLTLCAGAAHAGFEVRAQTAGLTMWKDRDNPRLIVVRTTQRSSLNAANWTDARVRDFLRARERVLADFELKTDVFSARAKTVVPGTRGAEVRGQYRHLVKNSFVSFHEILVAEKGLLTTYVMSFESNAGFQPQLVLKSEKAFRELVQTTVKTAAAPPADPVFEGALRAQTLRELLVPAAHASTAAPGAAPTSAACVPEGVIGSALGNLCQKLKASPLCQKFAQQNPNEALDCSKDPKGEASTWDYVKACGAGVMSEMGKVYDFAKMLVNAVINGQETAGKLAGEVKEFAQTAGAYVMSEYERNLAAASPPFKTGKAIMGVAGNLFQGIMVVIGELVESEAADLACRNAQSRMETLCAKLPYFLAGAGAAVLIKRLASYYGKLKRGRAVAKTEAELKAMSRAEREAYMNNLPRMSGDERADYAARMLQRDSLTPQQRAALEKAHAVGGERGYFDYTPAELRAKRQALLDGGFTDAEANVLLRSGAAGNPSFTAKIGPDGKVDIQSASAPDGVLQRGSHTDKLLFANQSLESGDLAAYQRARSVLAEDPQSPTRLRDLAATERDMGSARVSDALEADRKRHRAENFEAAPAQTTAKVHSADDTTRAWIKENDERIQRNQRIAMEGARTDYPDYHGDPTAKMRDAQTRIKAQQSVVEDMRIQVAMHTNYADEFESVVRGAAENPFWYDERLKAIAREEQRLRGMLDDYNRNFRRAR